VIYLKVILAGIFWAAVYIVVLVSLAYAVVDIAVHVATLFRSHP
jgi:hypothetical protein